MTEYQPGDKVRFANPLDEDEESLVMTVVEDRGNNVLVQTPVEGFDRIVPQATYSKAELVKINED